MTPTIQPEIAYFSKYVQYVRDTIVRIVRMIRRVP